MDDSYDYGLPYDMATIERALGTHKGAEGKGVMSAVTAFLATNEVCHGSRAAPE